MNASLRAMIANDPALKQAIDTLETETAVSLSNNDVTAAREAVVDRIAELCIVVATSYGETTDKILNSLSEPDENADKLVHLAAYIEGIANDPENADILGPHRIAEKLAQAKRLRWVARVEAEREHAEAEADEADALKHCGESPEGYAARIAAEGGL